MEEKTHFQCTEKNTVSQSFDVQVASPKSMVVYFWGARCAGDLCFVATIKKGKFFITNHLRGEKEASFVISMNHSAKQIIVISGTKIGCSGEGMDSNLLQWSKETRFEQLIW